MTVELAMALPLLLAVTVGLLWMLHVAVSQVRVTDAARETARALARGDDPSAAIGIGQQIAPSGAELTYQVSGGTVRVLARAAMVDPQGLWGFLEDLEVDATAVAVMEQ